MLQRELSRLQNLLAGLGVGWSPPAGASLESVTRIENRTGITFDDELKSLWRIANGSNRKSWFVAEPGGTAGFYLLSIEEAEEAWDRYQPYDENVYRSWHYDGSEGKTDRRIQPTFLKHRYWFPFAEWNGGSFSLQFDADPTSQGKYGQIIAYVHDPDQMLFIADSFLEFFRQSNNDLQAG